MGGGLLVGLVKPELGKQPNKAQLILKSFVPFHSLSLVIKLLHLQVHVSQQCF